MKLLKRPSKQQKLLNKMIFFTITHDDLEDTQSIAQDISKLHGQNFARGWSEEEIQNFLSSKDSFTVVAKQVGKQNNPLLGFIINRILVDEAEVLAIAVHEKHRKLGIGWQLMRASIEHLMSQNIRKFFLEVDEMNHTAIALYNNIGFKTVGKRGGYYAKENQAAGNALVMRLDLD